MAVMPTMMEIHFWPGRDRRGQYRSWKCKPENPFILRGDIRAWHLESDCAGDGHLHCASGKKSFGGHGKTGGRT